MSFCAAPVLGRSLAAALVVAACGAAAAVGQPIPTTPIALSGTDGPLGPGLGAGVFFGGTSLGSAVACINNAGQVIFRGADNATPTANNGVWIYTAGANSRVATNGGTVGSYTYGNSGFNSPIINAAGNTAWRYSTTALFGSTGSPAVLGQTTMLAPGTPGNTFGSFTNPAPLLGGGGHTAFVASLTLGVGSPAPVATGVNADASGIWGGVPGSVGLLVRQNAVYPDVSVTDVRLGTFGSSNAVNSTGKVFFAANLQGSVVATSGSANNAALMMYSPGGPGTLAVLARRGDPAPGSPGEFYNGITSSTTLDMNNAGKVVFNSALRNAATGGTQTAFSALFTDTTGPLTMAARAGNLMPTIAGASGTEFDGVSWGSTFSNNFINGSGTVLFQSSSMTGPGITTSNNNAIFTMSPAGVFTKVMRIGDASPALSTVAGDTVKFNTIQSGVTFNDLGQCAFTTTLLSTLGGVNGTIGNNIALFASDALGAIFLIAQRQTLFHVGPGDDRVVAAIGGTNGSGGQDGRAVSFNDLGDLVFSLDFTDGSSGVFVTHVPTPGAASLMALAGLVAAQRRRTRTR